MRTTFPWTNTSDRHAGHHGRLPRLTRLLALAGRAFGGSRHDRPSRFEPLEPRALLAAVAWDGGGDGTSWHDPLNWDSDVVPVGQDDVTLDVAANPTVLFNATTGARSINSLLTREAITFSGGSLTLATAATIDAATVRHNGGTWFGGTWQSINSGQVLGGALTVVACGGRGLVVGADLGGCGREEPTPQRQQEGDRADRRAPQRVDGGGS